MDQQLKFPLIQSTESLGENSSSSSLHSADFPVMRKVKKKTRSLYFLINKSVFVFEVLGLITMKCFSFVMLFAINRNQLDSKGRETITKVLKTNRKK